MSYNKYGSQFLKGLRKYRVEPELTASVIEEYLRSLDCPRALTVWIMFKENEHEQLANLAFDPLDFLDWKAVRDAYAATKFLSKYKDLLLDYDLSEVAIKKFEAYELLCKQTNIRFRCLSVDPLYRGTTVWLHHAVKLKIEQILGEFCCEEFFDSPNWGPGASTLIKRKNASSQEKFQCETGITRDLYSLLPIELLRTCYPVWAQHLEQIGFPCFQVGNKVITVPKDASTDRVIAVEPGVNLFFQLSVGNMIRRRLLRYGIDLTDQSRNQELARLGSISSELATIDFSSASDSIAYEVVRELLPPRWLCIMDSCRTAYGSYNDVTRVWEKFSSMGNGFTFPLQSLLFYAIAQACVEFVNPDTRTVGVYGDDVVIPTSVVEVFSGLVAFYGFRINARKSYITSSFRESCGAHYYSGFDVKPVFFKRRLSSVPTIYRLANALRRQAHRRGSHHVCDVCLRDVFDHLVRSVPRAFRLRIPDGFGDGGFISNFDEARPSRMKHGIEGYSVTHVTEVGKTHQDDRTGYLLAELWRISDRVTSVTGVGDLPKAILYSKKPSQLKAICALTELDMDSAAPYPINKEGRGRRNSVSEHQSSLSLTTKSCVRQWPDLGPWL